MESQTLTNEKFKSPRDRYKPKYDKHPDEGVVGMSGLRGFAEELLYKTAEHHGQSKIFVTEEKVVPQLTSEMANKLEKSSSMNRNTELEMTKFDAKKVSTGSLLNRNDSQEMYSSKPYLRQNSNNTSLQYGPGGSAQSIGSKIMTLETMTLRSKF